jgi:hypothetical protein
MGENAIESLLLPSELQHSGILETLTNYGATITASDATLKVMQ